MGVRLDYIPSFCSSPNFDATARPFHGGGNHHRSERYDDKHRDVYGYGDANPYGHGYEDTRSYGYAHGERNAIGHVQAISDGNDHGDQFANLFTDGYSHILSL